MNSKTIIILLSLIIGSLGNGRVVFRLDDIQDYWIDNAQQAVINVFKNAKLPMTVGVIANFFGQDAEMLDYIIECLQDEEFGMEVANHGYNHEDFPTFTLAEQITLLSEAKTMTVGMLSPYISNITTFIPPFDDFNDDTITALEATGYTAFSSDISYYGFDDNGDYNPEGARSYPGNNARFREYPAGSGTNDLYDAYAITVDQTMTGIEAQMAAAGFAVVMMHFNWYSSEDGSVNATMIDMLQEVVQNCIDAGYSFGTVGGLTEYLYPSSSSSSTTGKVASPVTTGKVPSLTTGKVATPLTTGKVATPITSGKVASPVTTGKAASPVTTGHAAASTTGKVASPLTTGAASAACTSGYMQCTTSETYETCNWGAWGVTQSCGAGTTCHPSGDYIYCY